MYCGNVTDIQVMEMCRWFSLCHLTPPHRHFACSSLPSFVPLSLTLMDHINRAPLVSSFSWVWPMGETSRIAEVGEREKQLHLVLILAQNHNEGARVAAAFWAKLLLSCVLGKRVARDLLPASSSPWVWGLYSLPGHFRTWGGHYFLLLTSRCFNFFDNFL